MMVCRRLRTTPDRRAGILRSDGTRNRTPAKYAKRTRMKTGSRKRRRSRAETSFLRSILTADARLNTGRLRSSIVTLVFIRDSIQVRLHPHEPLPAGQAASMARLFVGHVGSGFKNPC